MISRNTVIVVGILVIACTARLACYSPLKFSTVNEVSASDSGDAKRFLLQAQWLLQGRGFLDPREEKPCTWLPPGYPLFIATLFVFSKSLPLLVWIQVVLSVLSVLLVYIALRPRHTVLAMLAASVLAVSPLVAAYPSRILSETLGIFLAAVMAMLVSRFEENKAGLGDAFLAGGIAMFACLAVPAVTIVMGGIVAVLAWRSRASLGRLTGLAAGVLIVLIPWQAHCVSATGRVAPALLTSMPRHSHGAGLWMWTWCRGTKDFKSASMALVWTDNPPDRDYLLRCVPDYAYGSREERDTIERLARDFREGGGLRADDSEEYRRLDDEFRRITVERISGSPLKVHVLLPIARSVDLWVSTPLDSPAFLRLAIIATHVAMILIFIAVCIRVFKPKNGIAIAIIVGTIAYTAISSYDVYGEYRRNMPFIPMLLFLVYYCDFSAIYCRCLPTAEKEEDSP